MILSTLSDPPLSEGGSEPLTIGSTSKNLNVELSGHLMRSVIEISVSDTATRQ